MAEQKGFARFRVKKGGAPSFFEIELGKISVDARVKKLIEAVKKRYSDTAKYGNNAIKTNGETVTILLEQMVYARSKKKSARNKKKEQKAAAQ